MIYCRATTIIELSRPLKSRSNLSLTSHPDRRAIGRLAEFPELGPSRPEIAEDARSLLVERWLVLYRLIGTNLQVVRIIDGARDLKRIDWLID